MSNNAHSVGLEIASVHPQINEAATIVAVQAQINIRQPLNRKSLLLL